MILLIEPTAHALFRDDLTEMHQLRYRVFKERLAWTVTTEGDLEVDRFDASSPVYLLHRRCDHSPVEGCVRLLPSTGPTMLRDVFSALTNGKAVATAPAVWESSRFAVDTSSADHAARGGLAGATYELFAGMIEFGLYQNLIAIVTVTDLRMERILRRANWPLRRIAQPSMINGTLALAGYLESRSKHSAVFNRRRASALRCSGRPRLLLDMEADGANKVRPDRPPELQLSQSSTTTLVRGCKPCRIGHAHKPMTTRRLSRPAAGRGSF